MENVSDQFADIGIQLGTELEEKIKLLDEYSNDQPIDKVIQARIQQLAITKVLVKIHARHKSILTKAHCDLGESYMTKELFEQALYHFSIAKEINCGLFIDHEEAKQFHPFILMMLGKCYIEQQKLPEALENLEKALVMNEQQIGKDNISNVNIMTDLAFIHTKRGNHSLALKLYLKAIALIEKSKDPQLETLSSLYLDLAKTHEALREYKEAIKFQQKALELLKGMEGIDKIILANIRATLSDWCIKGREFAIAIDSIKQSVSTYEEIYGKNDIKTLNTLEKYADVLHDAEKLTEAIEKLKEVEEGRKTLFGNSSMKIGRLYKKLASWLEENNQDEEAKEYVDKSTKILGTKRTSKKQELNMSSDSIADYESRDIKKKQLNSSLIAGTGKRPRGEKSIKKSRRVIIRRTNY